MSCRPIRTPSELLPRSPGRRFRVFRNSFDQRDVSSHLLYMIFSDFGAFQRQKFSGPPPDSQSGYPPGASIAEIGEAAGLNQRFRMRSNFSSSFLMRFETARSIDRAALE